MKKQSKSEKKRTVFWFYLVLIAIWLFIWIVVDQALNEKRPEMSLYTMGTFLPIGLVIIFISAYHLEGVKLKDVHWLRIISFIVWMICFYLVLIWASTQESLTPLFYLMMIGLPMGIILLGVSVWPMAKRYD